MVESIEALAAEVDRQGRSLRISDRVLTALRLVPREEFVPEDQKPFAYLNRPLPIGHGQTISQPFIVALMTDLIAPEAHHRVLEIGTGSGYQAAVLARLVSHVYSIEIVAGLGREADATLRRLGISNVSTLIGDGYAGWPEHAPYDGIVVTAAAEQVPPALIEQLAPGGRLVIPVGALAQELMLIEKTADGATHRTDIIPVRFVPFTRDL